MPIPVIFVSAGGVPVTAVSGGGVPVFLGITVGSTAISGGTTGRVLYDNGGVVDESTVLTLATNQTVITGGTVATSTPALSITQTWADGGGGAGVFTGIFANFTNTSSSSASLPVQVQVSGSNIFTVSRAGSVVASGNYTAGSSGQYNFNGRSRILSGADGNISIQASAAATPVSSITTTSGSGTVIGWYQGTGSPESVVTARIGSFYSRYDGGANTSFYVKESGTGNTGWVAK